MSPVRHKIHTTEIVTDPSGEALPGSAERIRSPDEAVELGVSAHGGQVVLGQIAGRDVILPLRDKLFGVATDTRPNHPNSIEEGEAARPGGTFISFGGGEVTEEDGTARRVRIHGPFGAAWYKYGFKKLADNAVSLTGRWWDSLSNFFRKGEGYSVDRTVAAESAGGYAEGAIVITNKITSQSRTPFPMPELVEHTYYASEDNAVFIDASGDFVPVKEIEQSSPRAEHVLNDNKIDTRIGAAVTGTPGRCVFMPNGREGHVVVIDAVTVGPDGAQMPVETFCVYRRDLEDPYTAIEPATSGTMLQNGQSVSLTTHIQTFASLEHFRLSSTA